MFFEDAGSLRKFAAGFARGLNAPVCVALYGELGAGKTEFARAVIQELCGADTIVPSPTFTLVQEYESRVPNSKSRISHFDLYRIKNASELEEIGFFDAISKNIVLVEWPEIAADFLPKNTIRVHIRVKERERELIINY